MRTQKISFIVSAFAAILLLALISSARVGPAYAIVNCKIVPVSGPPVANGVIIIRDGLIESLGTQDKVVIPEDAEVIKADGLHAYPGLIDAHTNFFIEPPKEEPGQRATAAVAAQPEEKNWAQDASLMAFDLLKPKKTVVDSLHMVGITTILVAAEKGIYAGQSVLLNVNGEKAEAMVIKNPVALHINFTTERGRYPSSLMGTMAFLRQSFLDTSHYSTHKSLFSSSSRGLKRPEYDPYLEALYPFAVEKRPVFFNCANLEDIKRASRLIKEFKLNSFLTGANEAWRVADLVKELNVPLLVSLDFKPPFTSIYVNQGEEMKKKAEEEIYPANAAHLHDQKVRFALTSLGLNKPSDMVKNIQKAIKAGLPREEALKAMTIVPAQLLGVGDILGSLEPGKIANIILTSGEIFDEKTKVERVFVDGISFKVKQPPKKAQPTTLDLTGKWKAAISGPMGELEVNLDIQQEVNAISGKISSDMGQWD
ncbi:MAG: amidohydrolase family protein, partial [Candidatus Aminicenantes bacterium]|nr:amidohydrolase family protein [Candidatus Aminicenantes bacterium]